MFGVCFKMFLILDFFKKYFIKFGIWIFFVVDLEIGVLFELFEFFFFLVVVFFIDGLLR